MLLSVCLHMLNFYFSIIFLTFSSLSSPFLHGIVWNIFSQLIKAFAYRDLLFVSAFLCCLNNSCKKCYLRSLAILHSGFLKCFIITLCIKAAKCSLFNFSLLIVLEVLKSWVFYFHLKKRGLHALNIQFFAVWYKFFTVKLLQYSFVLCRSFHTHPTQNVEQNHRNTKFYKAESRKPEGL